MGFTKANIGSTLDSLMGEMGVEIEDGKVRKPSAATDAGKVSRPLKQSSSHLVGILQRQLAPVVKDPDHSIGADKIGKGKKPVKNSKKSAIEKSNMKKQKQEMGRPSPKAVRGGAEGRK